MLYLIVTLCLPRLRPSSYSSPVAQPTQAQHSLTMFSERTIHLCTFSDKSHILLLHIVIGARTGSTNAKVKATNEPTYLTLPDLRTCSGFIY